MGIFITIIIIIFIVSLIMNAISLPPYSDDKLINISNYLKKKCQNPYFKDKVMSIDINNINDYRKAWNYVIDMVYHNDYNRNIIAVNEWSIYVLAYYTEYVIEYGSRRENKR